MSTYAEQARALADSGRTGLAGVYVLSTLFACLLAVALGNRYSSQRARRVFEDEEGDL